MTVLDETWGARLTEAQRAVAERVLAGTRQTHVVVAPTGSGKSFMAASIAASLLKKSQPVLIVAPTLFAEQLALRAADAGNHPTFEITKAEVRAGPTRDDWPDDAIGIVTPEALRFSPLLKHIGKRKWGLAIVDDGSAGPQTMNAIQKLQHGGALERVLVLASPADALHWRSLDHVRETVWEQPSVISIAEREALLTFESLPYRRDEDEARLQGKVERLVKEFGHISEFGLDQLPMAAASSAFALQAHALRVFHRFRAARNAAAHGELHPKSADTPVDTGTLVRLTQELERIVVSVDELDYDAKLSALIARITDAADSRCVVFFALQDTARYVADALRTP